MSLQDTQLYDADHALLGMQPTSPEASITTPPPLVNKRELEISPPKASVHVFS